MSTKINDNLPPWSRRKLLSTAGLVSAAVATGGLAGCSSGGSGSSAKDIQDKITNPSDNLRRKGFPIVKKPVTLHYMTGKGRINKSDYNKVANWKHYQKTTNVTIDWGLVPSDNVGEKRNLSLSSGDYPEAFNTTGMGPRDVGKYASQGVFVKLNQLIDEYMPNLKKLMDSYDVIRRGITFPDGGLYAFPHLLDPEFSARFIQMKLWVRGDWLDKFDLDVPTDTEQYYQYLKKVKTQQPNGKSAAIGYCDRNGGGDLRAFLAGAFGVRNRGASQNYIDVDPSQQDKVRFFPIVDDHKALIEYMHKLYREKLIAQNIFSIDAAKVQGEGAKGTFGSINEASAAEYVGGAAKKMVPVPALKGPDGQHQYNNVVSPVKVLGAFTMTDRMEHPVEAARWVDHLYSDAGSKLIHMGIEDVSYHKTSHGPEYLHKITDDPDGATLEEALTPYVTYMGGGYPSIVKERYFRGMVTATDALEAVELLKPDKLEDVWPEFTYTEDESTKLDSVASDIEKYVDESTDKFVSGQRPLSDWGKYVDEIKKMGLDDYLQIQQAAYDRYRKQ